MNAITNTQTIRKNFIAIVDALDAQALNYIPQGYNNNIIWNFGHIIVTQQIICYKLTSLEPYVDDTLIAAYKKGSKPDGFVSSAEIDQLKVLAHTMLDHLQQDIEQERFQQFQEYTTSFGVTLTNLQEAISFNAIHESLHLGYAMALRRAVTQEMNLAQ